MKRKTFYGVLSMLIAIILLYSFTQYRHYQEKNKPQYNTFFTYEKQKKLKSVIIQNETLSMKQSKKIYQILRAMELKETTSIENKYAIAGGMAVSIQYDKDYNPIEICLFSKKIKIHGQFYDIINESSDENKTFVQQIYNIVGSYTY